MHNGGSFRRANKASDEGSHELWCVQLEQSFSGKDGVDVGESGIVAQKSWKKDRLEEQFLHRFCELLREFCVCWCGSMVALVVFVVVLLLLLLVLVVMLRLACFCRCRFGLFGIVLAELGKVDFAERRDKLELAEVLLEIAVGVGRTTVRLARKRRIQFSELIHRVLHKFGLLGQISL